MPDRKPPKEQPSIRCHASTRIDHSKRSRFHALGDMTYFNQNSFIMGALLALCIVSILLFRDGVRVRDLAALAAVTSAFGLSWLIVRPGPSTLADVEAVEAALGSGRTTLLEFQSEY